MTRRGATKAIVLAYLRHERDIGAMARALQAKHGIQPNTTRQQVWRLVRTGEVERIGVGRYRRVT